MKSIKRGRGPSFMGGVASIAMACFGVFWTITAISLGAPGMFAGFGLIFIGLAVAEAAYNFKNATGKNRYSEYDIVDENEEADPLNERFGEQRDEQAAPQPDEETREEFAFCPYCGTKREPAHIYCGKCGKKIA